MSSAFGSWVVVHQHEIDFTYALASCSDRVPALAWPSPDIDSPSTPRGPPRRGRDASTPRSLAKIQSAVESKILLSEWSGEKVRARFLVPDAVLAVATEPETWLWHVLERRGVRSMQRVLYSWHEIMSHQIRLQRVIRRQINLQCHRAQLTVMTMWKKEHRSANPPAPNLQLP